MRMLLKVQIPTETGNAAIKDGTLASVVKQALEGLNAEAAYFTAEDGMRTALIFFEMTDSSDIPAAAEPFFSGLNAQVTFSPVMNPEELGAGVAKAMQAG
jgi:hypothetical protein